jgi:hypothetical protein
MAYWRDGTVPFCLRVDGTAVSGVGGKMALMGVG